MAEFKCISCGYTEERKEAGGCPVCGYRMFETPYRRKDVLEAEIKRFFSQLEVKTVNREDLVFVGKAADDRRFPDYDRILKYVSGKDKTEDFQENLLETCMQLKLHFTSQFSKTYPVSFAKLEEAISKYDEVLIEAANELIPGFDVKFEPVEWKTAELLYSEVQNKYLWFSAKELIELIENHSKKIVRFIKVNNLYGSGHKSVPKSGKKCSQRILTTRRNSRTRSRKPKRP